MKIYVLVDEQEHGPYTKSEIFALMKDGTFQPDGLGRQEHESEWSPINKVLMGGTFGLFTPEQIAKRQEETPETIPLVTDFGPARTPTANPPPLAKRRPAPLLAFAAVATAVVTACSFFYLHREASQNDEPRESERGLAASPAMIASGPKASPTPSPQRTVARARPRPEDAPARAPESAPPAEPSASAGPPPISSPVASAPPPPTFPAQATAITLPTTKDITAVNMWISRQAENPRGVFVLCLPPDANAEEAVRNPGWLEFARKQQLALAAISFSSPKDLLKKNQGFVQAEKGAGRLLLDGIRQSGLAGLPLFVYGYGEGGKFASSFAGLPDAPVASWAVFASAIPRKANLANKHPVLIGCDYETTKVDSSLRMAFEDARGANLKWTWLSVVGSPNERLPRFQKFVVQYFSAVLATTPKNDVWMGIENLEPLTQSELMTSPERAAWLPDRSLAEEWSRMMPTPEQRKDPVVVRKVINTQVERQPRLEMFLRLPPQLSETRPLKGTLAFCTWAGDADVIQKQLLYRVDMKQLDLPGPTGVVARLIRYAEKHDLAILTWTTNRVWSLKGNSEELARKDEKEFDRNFDKVAAAWENGVKSLVRSNHIPDKDMLLYGISRGAQWAHRLALRKPDRFLAVHVHIPSTFDSPTPAANNLLWLVTTGEMESGYMRARRFYDECRKLGYPIIFKAIMGLGHSDSSLADNLGFRFFDYALAMRERRDQLAATKTNLLDRAAAERTGAWRSDFEKPPFVGDFLNQEIFPLAQARMVPVPLQVPLPTEGLAEAWDKK